ncbi:MAG TPA: FAD-dependent monooxygenase [Steroidobacteraceae bacterium]|jgi:kynurenine 3-monooxygenase
MIRYTIIGAGPVGTLMGLLLAQRGHPVRLIERRADPRGAPPPAGRSINLALAARGLKAIEQAHLFERVAPHIIAMPGRMLHELNGALQFLPYGQNEREVIYAVGRDRLGATLIEAAAAHPGIELQFETRCLDLDPVAATLTLRDERSGATHCEPFEIALAADGAGSAVRAALAAQGYTRVREVPLAHDYKELTIPARGAAGNGATWALEPHALHIWPRGGYMLIALPNVDGSFTATLFLARDGDPGFDRLAGDLSVRELFAQQFADAARLMPDLEGQFRAHPQGQLGTLYCQGWQAAGRVLLLGDAAHAIVPFHGQGLNCGLEDCRLLDQLLQQHGAPAEALRRFEAERRPDTDAIAAMALENYVEMRDAVRSTQFAQRQRLAAEFERAFGGRFIPRYSMVMFHPEIPYREAQRRGAEQERLLDAFVQRFDYGSLHPPGLIYAQQLLQAAGL